MRKSLCLLLSSKMPAIGTEESSGSNITFKSPRKHAHKHAWFVDYAEHDRFRCGQILPFQWMRGPLWLQAKIEASVKQPNGNLSKVSLSLECCVFYAQLTLLELSLSRILYAVFEYPCCFSHLRAIS